MQKMTYYRLLDKEHYNHIVRANGAFQQEYDNGEWVRSGILLDYQLEIAPFYNMYEEINESDVKDILGKEAIMD